MPPTGRLIAKALLGKYGAHQRTVDADGATPLLAAVRAAYTGVVRELLAAGASVVIGHWSASFFLADLSPALKAWSEGLPKLEQRLKRATSKGELLQCSSRSLLARMMSSPRCSSTRPARKGRVRTQVKHYMGDADIVALLMDRAEESNNVTSDEDAADGGRARGARSVRTQRRHYWRPLLQCVHVERKAKASPPSA